MAFYLLEPMQMKQGKSDLVVKSNRLIEASYKLTLAEQRIILAAIVEARRTQHGLSEKDFVTIRAVDYADMFKVPVKQAYEQIKEAALTLYERGFTLLDTHPETGKPRTIKGRWVSAATHIDGAGAIQVRFTPEILPYITQLEREFTRYQLARVAGMTSAYAIRLYELLMQWGSVGKREIELVWLKKALMLDKDYSRLFDFKKRVLDIAVFQVNEYSDLIARYTQRKTGKTVTHLLFIFSPKETPAQLPAPETEEVSTPARAKSPTQAIREGELFQQLREIGIGERLALSWIKQDEPRAKAALEYTNQRAQQGLIKGSVAGYLRRVFEDGSDLSSPPPKSAPKLTRKEIERRAKPGESWEQAESRIRREMGA
jgi:plasmid replication initiation protein